MSRQTWYIIIAVIVLIVLAYSFGLFGTRTAPVTPVVPPATTTTPPATTGGTTTNP